MISSFDKSGAAKLYKRAFIQNVNDCDYESALDNLWKYHDKVGNADFHLTCGILYFLMSQDSDDNELLVMASREFLLHLRLFPDCRVAYRDLIGTHMLRHDPTATLACTDFAAARGFNIDEMYSELSEAGVDLFMDESIGLDLDGMLGPGEFGEIDSSAVEVGEQKDLPSSSKPHVIKFRGGSTAQNQEKSDASQAKILSINRNHGRAEVVGVTDDEVDGPIEIDDELAEELSRELIDKIRSSDIKGGSDVAAQLALREAEQYCADENFEAAFSVLSSLKPSDGRFYYCGECLRSFIYIQMCDYDSARRAVDRAFAIIPHGALASTMLCKIYEDTKQFDKISDVLKNADVKDYTDAGHVYQAMRLAIDYCTPGDAIALAEEYIDEFNTMDIRMLYAQLLYNNGERKAALREMYKLSRIFYDDFNTRYYYRRAVDGAARMPIDEDAPQDVLNVAVNTFLLIHRDGLFVDDEYIKSDEYSAELELFLTLEYPSDKRVAYEMFKLLRTLAGDPRLETKMREALVSPYVEPIVKAVILSELLKASDKYLMSLAFCPLSDNEYKPPSAEYSHGFEIAYAFTVALARKSFSEFTALAEKLKAKLDAGPFDERDKAYYIIEKLKAGGGKKKWDSRIACALGYSSKAVAAQAFKAVDAYVEK